MREAASSETHRSIVWTFYTPIRGRPRPLPSLELLRIEILLPKPTMHEWTLCTSSRWPRVYA